MALSAGQMLGQYRIEAALGHGGMATVYRATQARLGRAVAIKMLHPAFVQDATFLARFEREAQIVAQLDHPHIVPVYDFSDYNGQPYLVMKYVDGTTLKQALESEPIALADALRIMTPIASALDYAHRQGVLHRDIKPANILIASDGTPWLTDFGLARLAALGSSTLSGDVLLGTPHYISPEQALGTQNLTPATDLYSFAVVLYELLTGRVPFTGDTPYAIVHAHIYDPLPPPRSANPELSPAIEAVLIKALAKEPDQRYPTAAALMQACRAAAQGAATAAPPVQTAATERPTAPAVIFTSAADPFESLLEHQPRVPSPVSPADDTGEPFGKPKRGVVETSFDFSAMGDSLRRAGESIKDTFEDLGDGGSQTDDDLAPPGDEAALRRRVERQLKKRTDFWKNALAYAVVNPILWVVSGVSAGSLAAAFGTDFPFTFTQFPWPLIVLLGWGAGLVGDAIETYHKTGARAARRLVRLHEEFRADFGPQWYHTASRRELKAVRKQADKPYKQRIDFQKGVASFAFVIPMLWIIYGFTSGILGAQSFGTEFPFALIQFPWPLIVMLFWGGGLIAEGLGLRGTRRTERSIEHEMERQRTLVQDALWGDEKPKNENQSTLHISEDGELSDSAIRDLNPAAPPARRG